jgi:WD40 repeat protein
VSGATVLEGGRLLSWSDDHTLRLWDAQTGKDLRVVSRRDAAHQTPELHASWVQANNADAFQSASAGSGGAGGARLSVSSRTAAWHADGYGSVDPLHHGHGRVSLAEAEALVANHK